jgi:hypothetical protein
VLIMAFSIANCRLPIFSLFRRPQLRLQIDNWQLAIGNLL